MRIRILYADKSVRLDVPINHDFIIPAANVEVEIHNRDFPDDLWTVEIIEEKESK